MAKPLEVAVGFAVLGGLAFFAYKHNQGSFQKDTSNLRMRISGISVNEGDFTINVKLQNPNSTDMEVKSYIGDLFANGRKIGEVKMFGDYIAKGNSEISIPLIARPVSKLANFLKAVKDIFTKGKASAEFVGLVNVNGHTLPLKMSYSL